MINRLLYSLVNRSDGFANPRLNARVWQPPARLSPELQELRALVFLDRPDAEYYLQNYLALLASFPEFMRPLADPVTTYTSADLLPSDLVISGARLVVEDIPPARVIPLSIALPAPLTYQMEYLAADSAAGICWETNERTTMPVRPSQTELSPQGVYLQVTWPPSWPFTGQLLLFQAWEPHAKVDLRSEPSAFPWAEWNTRLQPNPYFMDLLRRHDLLDIWAQAQTDQLKSAAALYVIARAHPLAYRQSQP